MEIYLENITNYLLENINEKREILDEISINLKLIIINENNNIKLDSFKKFILLGKDSKIMDEGKYIYLTYVLFLFFIDIHKDFKNDLLFFLKDKNNKSILEKVLRQFLSISGLASTNSKDISLLRIKLKIFNNFFEICRVILSDELVNNDNEFINQFMTIFAYLTKTDLHFHLANINEEVCQLLIMFFKHYCVFFKESDRNILIDNNTKEIDNLLNISRNELLEHIKLMDFVQFNKDFEFNFSNSIFLLLNLLNKDYMKDSIELLSNFENDASHFLVYLKSFILNFPNQNELIFLTSEIPIFKKFIQKYVIFIQENSDDYSNLTLMNFYKIFLENDLRSNYTLSINDVLTLSIHRMFTCNSKNLNEKFSNYIIENQIINKIFTKMGRDKNYFNIMDDNYYYILESLHKLSNECKGEVERVTNLYLNELLKKKERLMMIEARMFKFINYDKENFDNLNIMKAFFTYIFSKPYEKKNLSLINEYIKIIFEILFTHSINSRDRQIQISSYQRFIEIFPNSFFEYIFKVEPKDLKYLNNILANLEKFNKNLYSIIVYEFYKKYFIENNNLEYVQKFSIFLTLFKPFKNQKKSLMIKDGKLQFHHIILENDLEINFSIDFSELKNLAKLSDKYVVLYLIEFLIGLDEPEKVFPIIKTLLKYNVKSSYVEYKTSIMKVLTIYFNLYAEKILKNLQKSKPNQIEYDFVKSSIENFDFLFKFLSENIFDRSVENLLVYLEILKLNVDSFDRSFYEIKIKNDKMKILKEELISTYEKIIYNKELGFSLISLLRQSWYFVRWTAFYILKNKKFYSVLSDVKGFLTEQLRDFFYSLRQMDSEGSVNLFLLLLNHYKEDYLQNYSKSVLNLSNDVLNNLKSNQVSMKLVEICQILIDNKEENYINLIIEKNQDKNTCDYSVHSYYVMIRNVLEEEKETGDMDLDLLLEVGLKIIKINQKFSQLLINNGVAEFSTDFEDVTDGEDKGLISLWCSAKYSIEALNVLLEIINNNYKIISKRGDFENVLLQLQNFMIQIIDLMVEYKHMGAVTTLNDSLLKVAKLLNMSQENFQNFREISFDYLKEFFNKKLIQEEVCSILRRSAGIPFILTTLIKSYISNEKSSTFSDNRVAEILKYTIETLLNHYLTYQNIRPDVSVHCLHILRVISDDTQLKPFAKEYYDLIIFRIVDGLENENWSIKNACMLLFSRIIKNNFALGETREKNIPTFVEYFINKEELKKKIFNLLINETKNNKCDCDDYLILLITFFSKFKYSKLAEMKETDLCEIIDILFNLSHKNNKLFRKLLCNSLFKLSGPNIKLTHQKILDLLNQTNISNNKYDFIFDMIRGFKTTVENFEFLKTVEIIIKERIEDFIKNENYLVLNKIVKFYSKVLKSNGLNIEFILNNKNIIPISEVGKIDISVIFKNLKIKSRKPFYYKFIKNTINYFVSSENLVFNNFDFNLINYSNEELVNLILKKHPHSLLKSIGLQELTILLTEGDTIFKLNVNISTKIISYIIKNNEFNELLKSDLSLSKKVVSKFLEIIKKYKNVTKLVKKLLNIIPKLLPITNNSKYYSEFIEIIEFFCNSKNEEKIRFVALQAFENVLNLKENNNLSLDSIMRIFILVINDEHPEMRNYSCQILSDFNRKWKIIPMTNNLELIYSNEFYNERILNIVKNYTNGDNLDSLVNFFSYLITENFYFLKDKAKLNHDNKVFYYEPENRYFDNVEIKIKLIGKLNADNKNLLLTKLNEKFNHMEDIKPVNVLMMLETFVYFFTENFASLRSASTNENQFTLSKLRKSLYKY